LRKLKEGKIKEGDRGTLPEPWLELVERNTVAASGGAEHGTVNASCLDRCHEGYSFFSSLFSFQNLCVTLCLKA